MEKHGPVIPSTLHSLAVLDLQLAVGRDTMNHTLYSITQEQYFSYLLDFGQSPRILER